MSAGWSLLLIIITFPYSYALENVNYGVDRHLKVIAMHQPPFTFTRLDGSWTGIEVRFLEILSKPLNFTFRVTTAGTTLTAPTATWTSSDAAVVVELASGVADLGIGGVHLVPETAEANADVRAVHPHTPDCGVFLTQASLALPRHRAIMGPFHWKVWLSLTIAYVFGAVPLAILTSTNKWRIFMNPYRASSGPGEGRGNLWRKYCVPILLCIKMVFRAITEIIFRLHDAFWDVFGTFTNAFTLAKGWRSIGVRTTEEEEEMDDYNLEVKRRADELAKEPTDDYRRSSKVSWISSLEDLVMAAMVGTEGLRLLVAFYWAFTVIVSALYTGSIIAFITLPVFPKPYDRAQELLQAGYTWGTHATGDWPQWLRETDGPVGEQVRTLTAKAESFGCGCRGMRLFSTAEKAIRAVELSTSLAFLSSRSLLTYLIAHPASSHEDEEEEEEGSLLSLSLLRKVVGKKRKGPVLAMSSECFVPFRIGFLVKGGEEGKRISDALMRGLLMAEQSGLLEKSRRDADQEVGEGEEQEVNVKGDVVSSSEKRWKALHGKRLILGGGFRLGHGILTERVLGLDDMQGIFLLLGAGFAIATFVLFIEIIVSKLQGCYCPDLLAMSDSERDTDWDGGSEFSDDEMEEAEKECQLLKQLENETDGQGKRPWYPNFITIKSYASNSAPEIGMTMLEERFFRDKCSRRANSACVSYYRK